MIRNTVRSELIRIWRPSFLLGGIGVMAGFAALISVFIYTAAPDVSATTPDARAQAEDSPRSPRSPSRADTSPRSAR